MACCPPTAWATTSSSTPTTPAPRWDDWYGLRQQTEKGRGHLDRRRDPPSRCLSDFVAPKDSGIADYAGLFAVTGGLGREEARSLTRWTTQPHHVQEPLADRLAEAFAECLHHRVRTDLWGYAAGEQLSNDDMIAEKYQRHPPCARLPRLPRPQRQDRPVPRAERRRNRHGPDREPGHDARRQRERLLHDGHPTRVYFNVGKIGEDQLHDMAQRRGMDEKVLERLLAPNL